MKSPHVERPLDDDLEAELAGIVVALAAWLLIRDAARKTNANHSDRKASNRSQPFRAHLI